MQNFKVGDAVICVDTSHSVYLTFNREYKVLEIDTIGNIKVCACGFRWYAGSMFKIKESEMIERDKEYDLKVTGEDLAVLCLILGRSRIGYLDTLYDKLYAVTSKNIEKSHLSEPELEGMLIPISKDASWEAWLTHFFTKPETPEEKKLRELKEQADKVKAEFDKLMVEINNLER